jgi:(p)ppGpp synthase/HD superfamily hydrolase
MTGGHTNVSEMSDRPLLSDHFTDALVKACLWHGSQKRKKEHVTIPYVSHLLAVASLVLEDGGTEDQAIAGLLHDSVEDQGIELGTLVARYGAEVARIVDACSDAAGKVGEKKPPWKERKLHHLAKLRTLGPDEGVLRVTAADKLHNCRDIVADVRQQGIARLAGFNGGIDGTCWYYREMALLLEHNLPDSRLTSDLGREARLLHQFAGLEFAAEESPSV